MNKKVLCLQTLMAKTGAFHDILDFLLASKAINQETIYKIKLESDQSLALHILLEQLKAQDKLLLLNYEWQILPVERIKLFIVTEHDKREFTFN